MMEQSEKIWFYYFHNELKKNKIEKIKYQLKY